MRNYGKLEEEEEEEEGEGGRRRTRSGDLLIHDPRYCKSIEYRSSWYQFVVKTCLRRRMKGYAASGIQS